MKRLITSVVAMAAIISASAMSYSQAREQAWFLTDKMAYELYLTAPQVDAVYEINLDYIMNVDFMGEIFGTYWERRTKELSYVLTRSQMHTFLATEHFYRPISWVNSSFHFVIYDRYPTRTHFYYSAPKVYTTYKGEHRKSNNSRFEGKFNNDDVKPNVTGRTLSTRTGVSGSTNKGGFTSENKGTVTNGRTRPSDNMTGTNNGRTGANVTNSGNGSTRSGAATIHNEATKPSTAKATNASTIGSTRTATHQDRYCQWKQPQRQHHKQRNGQWKQPKHEQQQPHGYGQRKQPKHQQRQQWHSRSPSLKRNIGKKFFHKH